MATSNGKPTQGRLDRLTRRWWVVVLVLVLPNVLAPIVTKNHEQAYDDVGSLYDVLLGTALVTRLTSPLWIAFDVLPIALVLGVFVLGRRMARLFAFYAALSYLLFAVLQSVSVTERYGVGIVTGNLLSFTAVACLWVWEGVAGLNDFSRRRIPWWRWWVAPFAVFAFWLPIGWSYKAAGPVLQPLFFTRLHTGLAFCTMTPVYLAVLTLFWPRVNLALVRVTALVGIVIAFWNMMGAFVFTRYWYNGVVHAPLAVLSVYAAVLSFVRPRGGEAVATQLDFRTLHP